MAWINVMMGMTMPTAPTWLTPRRAAKNVSDKLYNELTSMPKMAGRESCKIKEGTA